MAKPRRSASQALDIPVNVHQFIKKGVPDDAEAEIPDGQASEPAKVVVANAASPAEISTHVTVDSSAEPKIHRRSTGKSSRKVHDALGGLSDELSLAFRKATVQKTVRFRPELIAQVEGWVRKQESRGEKPKAFQEIQNEALKLWIEKYN